MPSMNTEQHCIKIKYSFYKLKKKSSKWFQCMFYLPFHPKAGVNRFQLKKKKKFIAIGLFLVFRWIYGYFFWFQLTVYNLPQTKTLKASHIIIKSHSLEEHMLEF